MAPRDCLCQSTCTRSIVLSCVPSRCVCGDKVALRTCFKWSTVAMFCLLINQSINQSIKRGKKKGINQSQMEHKRIGQCQQCQRGVKKSGGAVRGVCTMMETRRWVFLCHVDDARPMMSQTASTILFFECECNALSTHPCSPSFAIDTFVLSTSSFFTYKILLSVMHCRDLSSFSTPPFSSKENTTRSCPCVIIVALSFGYYNNTSFLSLSFFP